MTSLYMVVYSSIIFFFKCKIQSFPSCKKIMPLLACSCTFPGKVILQTTKSFIFDDVYANMGYYILLKIHLIKYA